MFYVETDHVFKERGFWFVQNFWEMASDNEYLKIMLVAVQILWRF